MKSSASSAVAFLAWIVPRWEYPELLSGQEELRVAAGLQMLKHLCVFVGATILPDFSLEQPPRSRIKAVPECRRRGWSYTSYRRGLDRTLTTDDKDPE